MPLEYAPLTHTLLFGRYRPDDFNEINNTMQVPVIVQ